MEKLHKLSTKVVLRNEKIGRQFIASEDLAPGETILEERPLFVTPHWDCAQMKCANCYLDSFVMCKKCQLFPLCLDCTEHDEFDCAFFAKRGNEVSKNILVKNYGIYAALKLLLLMENEEKREDCSDILAKSVDLDAYRETEMWREHELIVVGPLLKSGVGELLKSTNIDGDMLHRLCILVDTNSFEVTSKQSDSLKAVFVSAAQFPHHCVPNTVVALDDDFNMKVYAAVDIKSGQVFYNSYVNPLMGTSQRQHQLQMTRRIECLCTRCLDPTELGTHMSSLKCKQCKDGYAMCDFGKGETSNWTCSSCKAEIDAYTVRELVTEVSEGMAATDGDLRIYEHMLAKYGKHFHPNHFLIINLKQNIGAILSSILMNSMCKPGKKVYQRKLQLCEETLPVIRAVMPGISKLYAIALFDYLLPFMELTELELQQGDITEETYHLKLQMAKDITHEILEMLRFEPPNSHEGNMVERIKREQKNIEEKINNITLKKN